MNSFYKLQSSNFARHFRMFFFIIIYLSLYIVVKQREINVTGNPSSSLQIKKKKNGWLKIHYLIIKLFRNLNSKQNGEKTLRYFSIFNLANSEHERDEFFFTEKEEKNSEQQQQQ